MSTKSICWMNFKQNKSIDRSCSLRIVTEKASNQSQLHDYDMVVEYDRI